MNLAIHSETKTSVMWSWLERLEGSVLLNLRGTKWSLNWHDYHKVLSSQSSFPTTTQDHTCHCTMEIRVTLGSLNDSSRNSRNWMTHPEIPGIEWLIGNSRNSMMQYCIILHHRLGYINPSLRGSNQSSPGLQSGETIQRPTAPSSRLNLNLLTQIHCCITVLICNKCC